MATILKKLSPTSNGSHLALVIETRQEGDLSVSRGGHTFVENGDKLLSKVGKEIAIGGLKLSAETYTDKKSGVQYTTKRWC